MNLIFDLDGTITDPELGITRCMVYALEQLDVEVPDRTQLRRCIGHPLRAVFGEILTTSDPVLIERAVGLYRERFGEVGLYENELYSGVVEALERLANSGHRLFLATAKAEVYAQRIITHFRLAHHFVKVYGATLSGEGSTKAELLARLVDEQCLAASQSVMVGDRAGDIEAARVCAMRSIGALWGYGTPEELAEADARVGSWKELVNKLDEMNSEQVS